VSVPIAIGIVEAGMANEPAFDKLRLKVQVLKRSCLLYSAPDFKGRIHALILFFSFCTKILNPFFVPVHFPHFKFWHFFVSIF
jgi:hypothetical protein